MIDVSTLLQKPKDGRAAVVRAISALVVIVSIEAISMPIAVAVYRATPTLEKAMRGTFFSFLMFCAWLAVYLNVNFAIRRLTNADRSLWVWINDCARDLTDHVKGGGKPS